MNDGSLMHTDHNWLISTHTSPQVLKTKYTALKQHCKHKLLGVNMQIIYHMSSHKQANLWWSIMMNITAK